MKVNRSKFITAAGALFVGGCAGGSSILIPNQGGKSIAANTPGGRSYAAAMQRTATSLRFGSGEHVTEVFLNDDMSISMHYNGVELIRHHVSVKTGTIWQSQGDLRSFLPLPSEFKGSQWYRGSNGLASTRFNTDFQRAEVMRPEGLFAAMGPSQFGGLNIGLAVQPQSAGAGGVRKAYHVPKHALANLQSEVNALVKSRNLAPPVLSDAAKARIATLRGQLMALKATPKTGKRTYGLSESCGLRCWSTEVVSSAGAILSEKTVCESYCVATSASTTQSVSATSSSSEQKSPLQCGLDLAGVILGAKGTVEVMKALGQLLSALAASFRAGMTVAEVAELVAFLLGTQGLAAAAAILLAAVTVALLAEAAWDFYTQCLASQ